MVKKCSKKKCQLIRGIKEVKNTCYMDTVLFALLAIPNKVIKNTLLSRKDTTTCSNICSKNCSKEVRLREMFRTFLQKIHTDIQEGKWTSSVPQIKSVIKDCDNYKYALDFSKYVQEDAKDFLEFLISLFALDNTRLLQLDLCLSKNLFRSLEKQYNLRESFVIVYINRVCGKGEKNRSIVKYKKTLNTGKRLHLTHIICHLGQTSVEGHYICYIMCGDNWYLYDNSKEFIRKIGGKLPDTIYRDGVLFFYS